ncbi:hypothetical protein AKJ51_00175 [candidate division MSBL1 archaeon SCGC-AAA382A20]|uniref:Uncharacterized protein n=1 Tax=candidate division MSBL1 archaeon SCGC-AAA382A20 TaxID=1698280 RepID=A0A133VMT7_9EURY|nr:hypothetical protein AKJ51_00175 [candidate division MSBL1 archaeon SCGC-AAA382A20]
MPKIVKLKDVEIKIPQETLKTLNQYGYEPEEAIGKHLKTKIEKNTAKLRRNKCPKCGKPTKRTLTRSQVKAVNHGDKTLEELGVCTCEES